MRYFTPSRTLVYYDGPQLLLGRDGRSTTYLAVAVPTPDVRTTEFLAIAVSESRLDDYFSDTVDLRMLFRRPKGDRYFKLSLQASQRGRFPLVELPSVDPDWIPSPGFFASMHTEEGQDALAYGKSVTDIRIDGRWDLQELAQFPNKYADTYAFLFAVTRDTAEQGIADTTEPFAELFQRYPWRGGYSSVSFYNDLYRAIPRPQKLRIREIRYASPGFIRIEASALLTRQIRMLVVSFIENWRQNKDAYSELHDGLSQREFLGASRQEVNPSPEDEAFVERACRKLSLAIGFDQVERVYMLCKGDWISASKILLSFFRRLEELCDFYESGKVSFDNLVAAEVYKD